MKIQFSKVAAMQLNNQQLKSVVGGASDDYDDSMEVDALAGEGRSDRRTGNCNYSRAHPETTTVHTTTGGEDRWLTHTVGCTSK